MSLPSPTQQKRVRRSASSGLLRRAVAAGIGVALLSLTLSSVRVSGSPAAKTLSATSAFRSPIRHVVIIYQENHSFDDVLGVVCKRREVRCNGFSGPVRFADGKTAPNIVGPDIVPIVSHVPSAQQLALANQWDKLAGCTKKPYACVAHYMPRNIPNLAVLADRFAVSSATFASSDTASFGAHITLAAGTMAGFLGKNPRPSTGTRPGPGWGCESNRVAQWAPPGGKELWVPSCIPDRHGRGPFRKSPVPYTPTVMERLEQHGLTWHIYHGQTNTEPVNNLWSICSYFSWCDDNRFTIRHDSRAHHFIRAANHGKLPNLSILLPLQDYSQHNSASMKVGDNYIGRMVQAAENSPQWKSTAIFITYDDCGCFYDHVKPPGNLGIRAPMVIVSPWVKHGYTDRSTAVLPYSMLAFVQRQFRLAPLTKNVTHSYNYRRAFNFNKPLLGRVKMTTSRIPRSERLKLAKMPSVEDDPT